MILCQTRQVATPFWTQRASQRNPVIATKLLLIYTNYTKFYYPVLYGECSQDALIAGIPIKLQSDRGCGLGDQLTPFLHCQSEDVCIPLNGRQWRLNSWMTMTPGLRCNYAVYRVLPTLVLTNRVQLTVYNVALTTARWC